MAKNTDWKDRILRALTLKDELARYMLCEFYSTLILSAIVHAAVAQETVSRSMSSFNIAVAVGMGVCLSVYAGFGVSGGHVNLALSVGIAAVGLFPWKRIPFYFLAQIAGGFLGAAFVYLVYKDAFDAFDGGTRQAFGDNGTAGVFATFPQPYMSVTAGFLEQVLNTAILLASIGAVMDRQNNPPPLSMAPFFFGLIVFTILMTYGYNAGAPLNPSVDLSGRLLLSTVGYGKEVWIPNGIHWWWIPIMGPTIGAAIGSWSYYFAVKLHHPRTSVEIEDTISLDVKSGNGNDNHSTRTISGIYREHDIDDVSGPLHVGILHHESLENEYTRDIHL